VSQTGEKQHVLNSHLLTQNQSYLYSSMATEVKIKLIWMCNVCIYGCSSWNIATSSNLEKRFFLRSAANNCLYISTVIKTTSSYSTRARFQWMNHLSTAWNVSTQQPRMF